MRVADAVAIDFEIVIVCFRLFVVPLDTDGDALAVAMDSDREAVSVADTDGVSDAELTGDSVTVALCECDTDSVSLASAGESVTERVNEGDVDVDVDGVKVTDSDIVSDADLETIAALSDTLCDLLAFLCLVDEVDTSALRVGVPSDDVADSDELRETLEVGVCDAEMLKDTALRVLRRVKVKDDSSCVTLTVLLGAVIDRLRVSVCVFEELKVWLEEPDSAFVKE